MSILSSDGTSPDTPAPAPVSDEVLAALQPAIDAAVAAALAAAAPVQNPSPPAAPRWLGPIPPDTENYVRGSTPIDVSSRGVIGAARRGILGLLAVLVAVLFLQASLHNTEIRALQTRGVQVDATVVSCFGILSGTGIQATGFRCQASFTVNGKTHTDEIKGTNQLYETGVHLAGVTDPSRLSTLYVEDAVKNAPAPKHSFVVPIVLLILLVVGVAGEVVYTRRRKPLEAEPKPEPAEPTEPAEPAER